jgi:hypothetical protein
MLDDLNESLKRLLIKHLKADGPVDVSIEQPTREWSAKINRPTVNFFLLKVLENRKLRDLNWEARQVAADQARRTWPARRVDVFYMVTAWATEPADEYHLLWRTLATLLRASPLPKEHYVGQLVYQQTPIILEAAQTEILENPAEIWSALNNEFKPSISLKVILELDLELVEEIPLVLTKKVVFADQQGRILAGEEIIQIGGTVYDQKGLPVVGARVRVVERDQAATTDNRGHFAFSHIPVGPYTLEATAPDGSARRRQVQLGDQREYDFTF